MWIAIPVIAIGFLLLLAVGFYLARTDPNAHGPHPDDSSGPRSSDG